MKLLDLSFAEYFAGIGLVRMGLEPFGWDIAFANDFSPKKFEMYQAFFPDAKKHYIVDDIFKLDPSKVPATNLATCSFPCIDLSLAGNMDGMLKGNHSSAFWGFIKILKSQKDSAPELVLLENVPGWLHSNKGKDFRITVQALNKLGYSCDVFTLDALRFTPQSRLRVFLVGTRLETKRNTVELLLTRPKSLLSDQLKKSLIGNKDLRWFYNNIPTPPPLKKGGLAEIIEQVAENSDLWWSEDEVKRHLDMMDELHARRVNELANGYRYSYRTFFRRRRKDKQRVEVRDDDIAGCLRTAVGGSGKQFVVRAGKDHIRMRSMTPREYARLQGVSDMYPITVKNVQALTGFGDAVCVPVISWIAENVINPIATGEANMSEYEVPVLQHFLLDKHGRQSLAKR